MRDFCNEVNYYLFSALANRTRLAIIDVLKDGRKSISELSKALELPENIITYNIEPLEDCVIVLPEVSGKKKVYSLNRELIVPLSDILFSHVDKFCPDLKACIPVEKLREYMKKEAEKLTFISHE